ncbi:putative amino-acid metabolite efflux pump [Tropicibacter naphthalenivorans]|uniref:Putative amino-acid metabolite efflux pump n=1 Tax=Tropicibacter naphthalenivorans TaxID=441103 RepID=A0A0P1GLE2_9RHOB|nr:DMT family transporter [Tropicibacter naphthalenivorans]CUH76827.1 putative amino-acid metabolite efflux pump [Tropicibacter naphthalenivorans]
MERKDSMDLVGAAGMVGFAATLAFNQVVIKVTNAGFGPVFAAGFRSILAVGLLLLWCLLSGRKLNGLRAALGPGLLLGVLFSAEFVFLFNALDMTSVSRASILFYSMPVWLTIIANFTLPGERLSRRRALGLVLAMAGVIWALADKDSQSGGTWAGDLLALCGAFAWAGIALTVRLTRVSEVSAESQLFYQLGVSAVVLTAISPLFGDLMRAPEALHWAGMGFQVVVACMGYLFWLYLMAIYPASDIAAFSFLSPVLAVGFGWALLDEPVGLGFLGALALVAVGVVLINRRKRV